MDNKSLGAFSVVGSRSESVGGNRSTDFEQLDISRSALVYVKPCALLGFVY